MHDEDKREFAAVVTASLGIYGKDVSRDMLRLWWAALEKFSITEVRQGFTLFLRSADSGTFAPKPADIIRMIEGSGADRGMLAWSKVSAAFSRVGAYQSVAFDDPTIHKVVEDMGGWIALCGGTEDEQPFKAAEFSKRYRAYCEAGGPQSFPSHLIGISEGENAAKGYKIAPPVLIGNPDECQRVIATGTSNASLQVTHQGGNVALLAARAVEQAAIGGAA